MRKVRILLCGEGPHEIGNLVWNKKISDFEQTEGWMQPIVRKLVGQDIDFGVKARSELVILPRDKSKFKPLPGGHGNKSLAAALNALQSGFDHVVYMADNDSKDAKVWQDNIDSIEAGFCAIDAGHSNIPCVPISTSECWVLADSEAWKIAVGADIGSIAKPESLWGVRTDPEGQHPKHVFARACEAGGVLDDQETRHLVANAADIEKIAQLCPISFEAFRTTINERINAPTAAPDTAQ